MTLPGWKLLEIKTMLGKSVLPFTPDEYWDWKEKLEAGYGQPRAGVSADQVKAELDQIPPAIRKTYIARKYLGNRGGERQ